jgi:hypothetical protein
LMLRTRKTSSANNLASWSVSWRIASTRGTVCPRCASQAMSRQFHVFALFSSWKFVFLSQDSAVILPVLLELTYGLEVRYEQNVGTIQTRCGFVSTSDGKNRAFSPFVASTDVLLGKEAWILMKKLLPCSATI